jgi:hypothetical protein
VSSSFFDGDNVNALFAALQSHALSLNIFRRVNLHEPENAPGEGLSCSIHLGPIAGDGTISGQTSVSGTITFLVWIWNPMMQKPLDGVDPAVLTAVSTLLNEYAGNFTLGETVRNIDCLKMRADPVYVEQEGKQFRVEQITLLIVIDDLWPLSP